MLEQHKALSIIAVTAAMLLGGCSSRVEWRGNAHDALKFDGQRKVLSCAAESDSSAQRDCAQRHDAHRSKLKEEARAKPSGT